ncbi:MAG: hypothetical protein WAT79_13960 [Saprospiraceae bacterium]
MKTKNFVLVVMLILMSGLFIHGQDLADNEGTGMPGDNFSLEGALDLFVNAENLEAFEKALNEKDNNITNLDLNEDGETDYIKIISQMSEDVHIFTLQVPVSENENQDIATIFLEKTGKEAAHIQIVGDEDIFGEEIIIEPSSEEKDEEVKKNQNVTNRTNDVVVVNVWQWPSVRYIYSPRYRPYVSPWRWRHYPVWWKPWRPLGWNVWRPLKVKHYRPKFRTVHFHRSVKAHGVYRTTRVRSTTVQTRYAPARANYKVTQTKTTVKGPRGNKVTKKTTKVQGNKGSVKTQKTKVKRSRKGG